MTNQKALGVQLYSVRDDLGPDVLPQTLARIAEMGFSHVEPYDILGYPDRLLEAMTAAGLVARTAHAKITELDRDAVIAAAVKLGIDTVIIPFVSPASIADRAGVEAFAADINDAARYAAGHGIRVGYHNHDFEFAQKIDGQSAYELLVSLLDERVVLELDTYWASVGGADVFELLPRLSSRVRFLHVVEEREPGHDRPILGVDIAGRMGEILALSADFVEMPVVEVVTHDSDVFPLLERNAAFFANGVRA